MKTKHLIFSLLAMFASFSAKAADGDTFTAPIGDENSRMTLKVLSEANRTVEVSSVSDNDVTAATIASTYTNGETEYTVVSIGNFAFLDKDNLIELNLPNTVTRIGLEAFKRCTALGSLGHTFTIPSSVTTIESEAFYNCGFVSGSIPASVTSVGTDAFYGTGWLQNQPDGIVYINNMVYTYKGTMPASSSLTVAEGTTRIINDAFKNQENLEAITLPSTLTAVESYAFSGCSNLTSVTVDATTPPTCPAVAFSNAANATLYVPGGLVETYQAATGWKNFSEIRENLNSPIVFKDAEFKAICIANWDTNNDGELSYAEAAAVTSVGSLLNNSSITCLNELQYFTGIETGTFSGCTKLVSIYIPKNITTLGNKPFENCTSLKQVVICDGDEPFLVGDGINDSGELLWWNTGSHTNMDSLYIGRVIKNRNSKYSSLRLSVSGVNLRAIGLGRSITSANASFISKLLVSESNLNSISVSSIDQWLGIKSQIPNRLSNSKLYMKNELVENLLIPEGTTSVDGFFSFINIKNVIFPTSVTTINSFAFNNCKGLITITIPNSVTSIGSSAFSGCSSLTSIIIPNSVTTIGSGAFQYCSNLKSVTFGNNLTSIGSNAFDGTNIGDAHFTRMSPCSIADAIKQKFGTIVVPDAVVDDYKTAWTNVAERIVGESDYNTLKSYTVSANASSSALVEEVGENNTLKVVKLKVSGTINSYDMFVMKTKMVNLRELDLSDATIVANAYNYGTDVSANNVFPDFLNGKVLYSLILPNTITEIKSSALSNCRGLESITIPASVTTIGSTVFRSQLRSVEFAPSSQLTTISSSAFKGTSIESFVAPASLTTLGANAFENCTSLISITLSVPRIGNYAFKGCTSLATVTLQNGVTTIGNYAFEGCTALKNVTIPTGVTSIGDYAFNGCSALPSIELPQGLTSVSQYAFQNCSALTTVTIHEGVTSIGNNAFSGCRALANITLPQSLTTLGQYAFQTCTNLESITIPSVKTIAQSTFNGCTILSEVKLSPQTTTIEQYAFTNCNALTEIHLPPFLKTIGNNAFSGCSKLMTIYAYMPDIITIGSSTFPNQANATLYVPAFLYNNYYYDTNWGKFLNVLPCDLQPGDYAAFYTNGDIIFEQGAQRITEDTPIAEIGSQGGVIVQGEPQQFDTVDQTIGDMNSTTSTGASLIGDGTTAQENNLPMNELRVKMTVQAKKWYFFCFPFDVTIEQCEYPGRYVWRYYDGAIRAANGSGGWQPVTGETLTARQGYAFQSETAGTLVVKFNHPTFGGDRVKELVAHATSNAANASWNFIGNPYSSYYDFRSEDITSPITIWNGSSYVAYRPGDDECHLKPYQAFFVQKPTASVQVTFNVQRRETYRQSEATKAARMNARRKQGISPKRRLINLEIMSDTVMLDRTRVVLNQKAASAYELEYDAAKFLSDDSKAQIYSVENGIQMAINERPLAGDIRLGYTAKKAGRLSISAPRMDIPMLLVDTKLNTTFDLTLGTYDFDTSAGTFNDRFLLRQGGDATAINNLTAKTGVCFGTQDGGIAIGGAEGKTVNVYTTGGALAAQHSGNGFIALKSGVYVVSVDGVSAKVSVK